MLTIYDFNCGMLTKRDGLGALTDASVWLDLFDPTPEEDKHVEAMLGIEIPTRAEAREIEAFPPRYEGAATQEYDKRPERCRPRRPIAPHPTRNPPLE